MFPYSSLAWIRKYTVQKMIFIVEDFFIFLCNDTGVPYSCNPHTEIYMSSYSRWWSIDGPGSTSIQSEHGRNSCPEVFCKRDVLRNFAKFKLKKRLWHRCFPVNFAKFLRTPFSIEHLWWLFLTRKNIVPKMLVFKIVLRNASCNNFLFVTEILGISLFLNLISIQFL